jgi:catechol 2,3-dioxygenase-like lactoylglutathione lyase family enzyme
MTWRLDHIQLAIPTGGENAARDFWVRLFGMTEVPKPDALAGRGGLWVTRGAVNLHLGVETPFAPARKAHPCLAIDDIDALAAALVAAQHPFAWDGNIPGIRRLFVSDPFGNRVEVMQA